ncbi:MAG: type II toxin-antitoxin system VapC family toxin [Chloroflexi bacterium]|nr:type II toxin-antitoxin system VapC family toxin [Chloroflexota bacterium]
MSFFLLDTSAIVKRYKTEVGTIWVEALTDLTTKNTIILSEITLAEVAAALAALHRVPGGVTKPERDRALKLFLGHCDRNYRLIAVNRSIIDRAVSLTQNHKLRGYDAVQLATGLITHQSLTTAKLSSLTFITADDDLLAAAQAEGLTSDNPNHYP